MEWVETTGRSVEEATALALDALGIGIDDAEVEVLAEARTGLFGKLREEARVRARVRPSTPRPKDDRRRRTKDAGPPKDAEAPVAAAPAPVEERAAAPAAAPKKAPQKRRAPKEEERDVEDQERGADVPVAEQAEIGKEFVEGLLAAMGLEATTVVHLIDEETAELQVNGGDLGLLIGPKGATLLAIQDLARTVVQRRTAARHGRLMLDVSGYRAKRREALERFTQKVAADVVAKGTAIALEPMTAADRKVVHDTANDIEGVVTSSQGEDPSRRVVIQPA